MNTAANITKWAILNYKGQQVEVLAVDSDPAADVWVKLLSDPDKSFFVPRSALTA
ncbi:hypothetical protein SEA_CAPTAINREX_52 [Microbacterium phage CaptainRex]|nr:hypothetical protein SEA_HASITHA_52 [Microbacterium phage Hasitha]UVK59209.1 hypothetical protein SEA_LIBRIE_52 [Microbacterium phage Librie]WIC89882.1 hypothetical protein SEA_CAPTAINREX_52 [Microbacterium phage CaptainRex]